MLKRTIRGREGRFKEGRQRAEKSDFESKFRTCAGRQLSPTQTETLYQRVMELETMPDIAQLTTAMTRV